MFGADEVVDYIDDFGFAGGALEDVVEVAELGHFADGVERLYVGGEAVAEFGLELDVAGAGRG